MREAKFKTGDKVKINKLMRHDMNKYKGKTGVVDVVSSDGYVTVKVKGFGRTMEFHPNELVSEEIKSTITESPSPYTPKERARVVKNLKDRNYLPAMPDADRKVLLAALETLLATI